MIDYIIIAMKKASRFTVTAFLKTCDEGLCLNVEITNE
jgi:hypothetical protein